MKSLKEIRKQIEKVTESIETKTAEIMKLDYKEEKRAAAQNGGYFNNKGYKELHDAAQANADQIRKLSDEIYNSEIECRILQDNARAALFAEAYPVIVKACEKYNGKQYGEKTKEAIKKEVNAAGFGFYFDGSSLDTYRVNIYELDTNGYYSHGYEVTANATDENGHFAVFITKDNKINVANVSANCHNKYTENPAQAAKKTAKAIKAYQEATKKIEEQRRELCDMLPEGIKQPEYIREYYLYF